MDFALYVDALDNAQFSSLQLLNSQHSSIRDEFNATNTNTVEAIIQPGALELWVGANANRYLNTFFCIKCLIFYYIIRRHTVSCVKRMDNSSAFLPSYSINPIIITEGQTREMNFLRPPAHQTHAIISYAG